MLASCRGASRFDTIQARIVRGPKDSTAFTASAVLHACRGGGLLFDATNGPNGVLAWVKSPQPVTASAYPLLGRADSMTPRGAVVAVRFIWHDVAHGFSVDSGTLTLSAAGRWYRGRIQGSGTDLGLAIKNSVDLTIDSIQPGPDTIACGAKG